MNNQYYLLRHGQSKANVLGIIVSHLKNGVKDEYSLTPVGEQQVEQAVTTAKNVETLDGGTLIYCSPMSRCKRTAEIAQKVLGTPEITVEFALRERCFGGLEFGPERYIEVWVLDARDPDHTTFGVESAREVQRRMVSFVRSLEKRHKGKKILLVSHGDPLQILRTFPSRTSPGDHRILRYIETGEIVRLPSIKYW